MGRFCDIWSGGTSFAEKMMIYAHWNEWLGVGNMQKIKSYCKVIISFLEIRTIELFETRCKHSLFCTAGCIFILSGLHNLNSVIYWTLLNRTHRRFQGSSVVVNIRYDKWDGIACCRNNSIFSGSQHKRGHEPNSFILKL